MVYVVAYDLKEPNTAADYAKIIDAIKAYGTWLKLEQSVWLIEVNKSHVEIRDELMKFVRPQDTLFVARTTAAAWTHSLSEDRKNWLNTRQTWAVPQ